MANEHNPIVVKTLALAIEIVKLVKHLQQDKKDYILSKQLMRSGTAPGALVREALQAESNADFVHKLSIALKEAHETDYWLALLSDSKLINKTDYMFLYQNLGEVTALLTSIIKTSKNKVANPKK